MARRALDSKQPPAAKVLAVLGAIAREPNAPMVALAEELELSPPTVHRICTELERLGYVQRMPESRRFTVAAPMVRLASDTLRAAAGLAVPQALLRGLSEQIGEMCSLGVAVGDEVVYIASAAPRQQQNLVFRAGRRAPLFCTSSGRLFLAQMDRADIDAYLAVSHRPAFTRFTVTDAKRLRAEIARAAKQGYAVSHQQYVLHIVGAAVPVRTKANEMIAALSVAAPTVRLSLAGVRRLVPRLQAAAKQLAPCLAPA